jgi:hypothetical protein
MDGFDKLELSTETLRVLTREEMQEVAGGTGQISRTCIIINPTPAYAVLGYTEQVLSLNCAQTGG